MKDSLAFALLFTFALLGCGIGDEKKEMPQEAQVTTLTCSSRPLLLRKSESYTLSWSWTDASAGSLATLITNDEDGLDWGTLTQTDDHTATFTASGYIPGLRKLTMDVTVPGNAALAGSCPIYVLDNASYGVDDDGNTIGLVADVYPVPTSTPGNVFPILSGGPQHTAVVRNFDMLNVAIFSGITDMTQFFAIRFSGTLSVPTTNDYQFRLQANNLGNFYVDGNKLVTSLNNGQATSAAAGTRLTAGKHSLSMEYLDISTGTASLRLEWAARATPTTFGPFTVIPYSAFDRK